jgi:hypothetical protein
MMRRGTCVLNSSSPSGPRGIVTAEVVTAAAPAQEDAGEAATRGEASTTSTTTTSSSTTTTTTTTTTVTKTATTTTTTTLRYDFSGFANDAREASLLVSHPSDGGRVDILELAAISATGRCWGAASVAGDLLLGLLEGGTGSSGGGGGSGGSSSGSGGGSSGGSSSSNNSSSSSSSTTTTTTSSSGSAGRAGGDGGARSGGGGASITLVCDGVTVALENAPLLPRCSPCLVPMDWVGLPLIDRSFYNHNVLRLSFALPPSCALDLPPFACLLVRFGLPFLILFSALRCHNCTLCLACLLVQHQQMSALSFSQSLRSLLDSQRFR